MKKIDFYAPHEPWKVPKWMGITLGTIFSAVAVTAAILIVHLTRDTRPTAPIAVAAATVSAPAATARVETPPPVQPENQQPAVSAAHTSHNKRTSHRKVASRRYSHAKSAAILARHDSKEKRRQKDDLDRLLGL